MGQETGDALATPDATASDPRPVPDSAAERARAETVTPVPGGFVPVLRDDLGFTVVADHLVLHDASTHRTHVLNVTSARIWAAIDGRHTTEEIGRSLATGTRADPAVVALDVARAIGQFASLGILAPSGDHEEEQEDDQSSPEPDQARLPATDRSPGAETGQGSPSATTILQGPTTDPEPPWSTTGPRRALGASFVVRTDDPRLAVLFEDMVAPYPTTDRADHAITVLGGPSGGHRVLIHDVAAGEAGSPQDAVELIISHLNQLAVAHTAGRLLLHAGVVERDGRAVVIVGPSGRGKSTLTAALVLAGFAYLTDEVAAIDPTTGWIDPFPKPLSLSHATRDLLGLPPAPGTGHEAEGTKHPVAPGALGATSRGGRVGLLVVLEDPDPTVPALPSGTSGDAPSAVTGFLDLLEQTFAETMAVPDALEHLGRLYRQTPVLHLPRQAPDAMVQAVLEAC